jgi:hypothetical protein
MKMKFVKFSDDDVIPVGRRKRFYVIAEGEKIKKFFFHLNISILGIAVVIKGPPDEKSSELHSFDCFGAKALTLAQPPNVSVKAKGFLKCARMTKQDFKKFVQPELKIIKEQSIQFRLFDKQVVLV